MGGDELPPAVRRLLGGAVGADEVSGNQDDCRRHLHQKYDMKVVPTSR